MVDERPICASCPVCRRALDLSAVEVGGTWYCSMACAEGRPRAERPEPVVPEPWLYVRPRRFFRKRRPKELNLPSDATRGQAGPA